MRRGPHVARPVDAMEEGQALVVVDDVNLAPPWRDAHVVRTMLEMITWLEHATTQLVTVILVGDYARDREVVGFLRETYPAAQLVLVGSRRTSMATGKAHDAQLAR